MSISQETSPVKEDIAPREGVSVSAGEYTQERQGFITRVADRMAARFEKYDENKARKFHDKNEQDAADFYAVFDGFETSETPVDRIKQARNSLKSIGYTVFGFFDTSLSPEHEARIRQGEIGQAEQLVAREALKIKKQTDRDINRQKIADMDTAWKKQNREAREARSQRAQVRREARHERWEARKESFIGTSKTAAADMGAATLNAVRAARNIVNNHEKSDK